MKRYTAFSDFRPECFIAEISKVVEVVGYNLNEDCYMLYLCKSLFRWEALIEPQVMGKGRSKWGKGRRQSILLFFIFLISGEKDPIEVSSHFGTHSLSIMALAGYFLEYGQTMLFSLIEENLVYCLFKKWQFRQLSAEGENAVEK